MSAAARFPLHRLVWRNDFRQLEAALQGQLAPRVAGGGGKGRGPRMPAALASVPSRRSLSLCASHPTTPISPAHPSPSGPGRPLPSRLPLGWHLLGPEAEGPAGEEPPFPLPSFPQAWLGSGGRGDPPPHQQVPPSEKWLLLFPLPKFSPVWLGRVAHPTRQPPPQGEKGLLLEGRKARRGLPGRCLISELACLCVGAKQHRCRRAGAASVGSMVCLQKGHNPVSVPGGLWGSSEELSSLSFSQDVEQRDPRGRSLLHLAVSLGYVESVRVLLRHKADVTKENAQGWTVLHEAISTGDPEIVHMVLQHRDYQQTSTTLGGVPELLQKISETPDFYVEMKWEFTSWVPLVSRVCPSDVCRIWKSGAKLRVDITLLGFENMSWERGRRSLIFRGEDTGHWAELIEVNHDDKVVAAERFEITQQIKRLTLDSMVPKNKEVERRLTSPILSTSLDTRNIAFERDTSGFWVWKTERSEVVNDYEAKVFTANNVNVVTRIRTEHLTEEEKRRYKADRNPLESFLGTIEHEYGAQQDLTTEFASTNNPTALTPEEYFEPQFDLKDRDIGRPKEVTIRTQKFKANLWMSEEFPLSLVEQVSPIVDLMARTSAHFARLKDFITLDFPPGFPVKIEIPLFHILNARITFGCVNSCSTLEEASTQGPEGSQGTAAAPASPFVVDPSVFEIPKSYRVQDDGRNLHVQDEDNEIMQFAIQQSLMESGHNQEPLGPPLNGDVSYSQDLHLHYQRALQESLLASGGNNPSLRGSSTFDQELQLAMALSLQEQQEQEQRRQEEEEEELKEALQRSLLEK